MSKRNSKELEAAQRRSKGLQKDNARLAAELAEARELIEKGAAMLMEIGGRLDLAQAEASRAREAAAAAQAEASAVVAKAQTEIAAAEEREQLHKVRLALAQKIAFRLWKALAMLDDQVDEEGKKKPRNDKKQCADATAFRDVHVRRGELGLELLTD